MKRNWKIIFILMIVLFLLALSSLYLSKNYLTVSHYQLSIEKLHNSIRIVQLTDLHNSQFGNQNELLIDKVAEQSPDLIVLTGDLLNSNEQDTSVVLDLIGEMSKIAPTYASYGNHEKQHEKNFSTDLTVLFEQAGAKMLEFSYEDIEIKGQKLRIGGLYGYCLPEKYLRNNETDERECAFLKEFQNTESFSILLTHMPYSWITKDGLNEWDIDCVFTGHDHGGLVRIPLIGGLYAPDQGWFPGKDYGLYDSEDGKNVMILSRGLGKSGRIPRFNNVPEIVVLDIVTEKRI